MSGPLTELFEAEGERDNFVLISIGVSDSADNLARKLAEQEYGWTFVYDPYDAAARSSEFDVGADYGVSGIPMIVRVDPEGNVAGIGHREIRNMPAVLLADTDRTETELSVEAGASVEGTVREQGEVAYRFEAPATARYRIRTTGELDTILTIYGDDGEEEIARNDDERRPDIVTSLVIVALEEGDIVYVAVTGFRRNHGPFGLELSRLPAAEGESTEEPADTEPPPEGEGRGNSGGDPEEGE